MINTELTALKRRRAYSRNAQALFERANHPAVAKVCEILDCGLVADYEGSPRQGRTVIAIGERANASACLAGFAATPHFPTTTELEDFCGKNLEQYRALNIERDGLPAKWFWQAI